jgi:hemoglobin-like flavoprotein
MSLTNRQIELVEHSWDFVITNTDEAGKIFYSKLFAMAPEVRPLFSENIDEQAMKLVSLITFAVNKLRNIGEIVADVQALGKRHKGYGVKAEHYALVGAALLETLELANGSRWNAELKAAWANVFYVLSETMIEASKG